MHIFHLLYINILCVFNISLLFFFGFLFSFHKKIFWNLYLFIKMPKADLLCIVKAAVVSTAAFNRSFLKMAVRAAQEWNTAPDILQFHADNTEGRNDIQRLQQICALVAIDKGIQAIDKISSLYLVYSFDNERTLNCELTAMRRNEQVDQAGR